MLDFVFYLIPKPFMQSIFRGISSDPGTPVAWNNLYHNIYFRFIFIFIVVFQNSKNKIDALITTVATMVFFYLISTKDEKKKMLKDNHKNKDLETFFYFSVFVVSIYYLKKKMIPQEIINKFNLFDIFS